MPVYVSHFFHSPDSMSNSMVPHNDRKTVTTATTSGWSSLVPDCIDNLTELSVVLKYIWFGLPKHTEYYFWNSLLEANASETCCLVFIKLCSLFLTVIGYSKIYFSLYFVTVLSLNDTEVKEANNYGQ